jgi:hypothetical protein
MSHITSRSPFLQDVSSARGAPMGRRQGPAVGVPAEDWKLAMITIDRQGYDIGGAYWGVGEPLWLATSADAVGDALWSYFRASNRMQAKEILRSDFPGAGIQPDVIDPDAIDAGLLPDLPAGYVEALLWSKASPGVSREDWIRAAGDASPDFEGELPEGLCTLDLHPDALARIARTCQEFEETGPARRWRKRPPATATGFSRPGATCSSPAMGPGSGSTIATGSAARLRRR